MPVEGPGQSSSFSGVGHFLRQHAIKGLKKAFGRSAGKATNINEKNRISREPSKVSTKPLLARKAAIRRGGKYLQIREAYQHKQALKERSYQFDPKDKASVRAWAQELRANSRDARKEAAQTMEQQGREVTKELLLEKAMGRIPYEEGDLEWLSYLKEFGEFEISFCISLPRVAQAVVRHAGFEQTTMANRLATRSREFIRQAESARKDYLMQQTINCSEEEMAQKLQTIIGFPYGLREDLNDLNDRLARQKNLGLADRLRVAGIKKKIRKLMEDPERRRDIMAVNSVVTEIRRDLDKMSALKNSILTGPPVIQMPADSPGRLWGIRVKSGARLKIFDQ